jgi:outer membrane protein OmpA-like peptidoglycan-associated protein
MSWSAVAGRTLCRAGIIIALLTGSARAEDASPDDILNALAPRTRGLSLGPSSPRASWPSGDNAFLDRLRGRPSHTVSAEDREKLAQMSVKMRQIDLIIEFDRGSDVLRGAALATANSLGRALTSERLRGQTITIAGHTDAKGSEAVNQVLSERRAEAVKRYLVATFGVPASDLITVGYGETRLKNPADPEGRENRRVQVVNMLSVQTAGR